MTLASVPRYRRGRCPRVGGHAVVVGGSVAGLLSARVLADGFDRVTVLERDPLPEEPVARRGVPQGGHIHVLLEAGRATLSDLFPGYGEELLAAGGLSIDTATDLDHYQAGGVLADGQERLPMYCASRPLLEGVVRGRVAALDGVEVLAGHHVTGYRLDERGSAVTGVTARDGGGREDALAADLVVDATGRTTRTPAWLEANGFDSPPVDEVRIDVAYTTVAIERPADDRRGFFAPPASPRTRGVAVIPVEGPRWLVTLLGVHGDHPPTDPAGLRDFAASLPLDEPARLLCERPWASEGGDHHPFPSTRRYRFEDLDRFPAGLVVLGDAVASFNPIYGQGMSVAALEALELHHALVARGRENLARRFFGRAAGVVDAAWLLAVGADVAFPQTVGPRPRGVNLFNRYLSRLLRCAHDDPVLSDAFYRVLRLEEPPTALLRPGIARRVLLPVG